MMLEILSILADGAIADTGTQPVSNLILIDLTLLCRRYRYNQIFCYPI